MSKGNQTRQMIIETAASFLNRHGYLAFSMSSIMSETGLEKGGIYNHFKSKEELAYAAFDHAVNARIAHIRQALAPHRNAVDQLKAFASTFLDRGNSVPGGCPIMNAAIESDDAHPALCEKAREAMTRFQDLIRSIVTTGIEHGEIRPRTDEEQISVLLMSTLEGALMMSKLYSDLAPLQRAVQHLHAYLDESVRT